MHIDTKHETQTIWPPAPTLGTPTSATRPKSPPLWVVIAINGGGSMILVASKIAGQWHNNRSIDWQADAKDGAFLFILTMAIQGWVRRKVRRQEAKAAQALSKE